MVRITLATCALTLALFAGACEMGNGEENGIIENGEENGLLEQEEENGVFEEEE